MTLNPRLLSRRSTGIPGRAMSLVPKVSMSGQRKKKENRVIINVGGVRYETYKSTLKNIPDTRLSWLTETNETNADFDSETGEYFFDRHPGVFLMILNYYRTGQLHAPSDVCGPLFESELAFWGIDEKQIESCCWSNYNTHRDAQETLRELEGESDGDSDGDETQTVAERFGIEEENRPTQTCWNRFRARMWTLLEEPNSSKGAQVIAIISVLFVILSISMFCMDTHLTFRVPRNDSMPLNHSWTRTEKTTYSKPHVALVIIDYICVAYFTLEFILRITMAPNKKDFLKGVLNIIDLVALIPFYVEKTIVWSEPGWENTVPLHILKTFKLARIFRIFKLTRHFSGLKILWHSIKASAKELILMILFLVISVLIFACLIYYAESADEHADNDFKNIPIGFWWAVVTMTTVGYGDIHPKTGLGYFVGGLCAVSGVLVLALPVPVIVNNFALYYSHAQARLKLPKKRKKILVGAPDQLKTQTVLPGVVEDRNVAESRPSSSSSSSSSDSEDDASVKSNNEVRCNGVHSPGISVIFTDDQPDSDSTPTTLQLPANGPTSNANGSVPNGVVCVTVTSPEAESKAVINQEVETPILKLPPILANGKGPPSEHPPSSDNHSNKMSSAAPRRRHSIFPRQNKMAEVDV